MVWKLCQPEVMLHEVYVTTPSKQLHKLRKNQQSKSRLRLHFLDSTISSTSSKLLRVLYNEMRLPYKYYERTEVHFEMMVSFLLKLPHVKSTALIIPSDFSVSKPSHFRLSRTIYPQL